MAGIFAPQPTTVERRGFAQGDRLAPFVPSPQPMVDEMLALAQPGPDDMVYDLGSGNGQIVITAAQRFGARATGIEIDRDLVRLSSARIAEGGLGSRARIVHGDFMSTDLRPATIVTLYQLPAVNELLRPLFEAQLRPGARVVSLDFPIPGWRVARVVTATLPDSSQHAVYLYSIGQTREVTVAERTYGVGRDFLELDGASVGPVKSVDGGAASAEVVTEMVGAGTWRKHVANVKYDDITITCGAGMSKVLYAWVADTLNQAYVRKSGAIVAADFDYNEVSRLNFNNAIISEIGFPASDGASKDAANLTIAVSPEYTQRSTGRGAPVASTSAKAQKQWLQSNFRLDIPGLDCSRVSKVDAITIRRPPVEDSVGELRDYEIQAGYVEFPNLVVVLPESHAETFYNWFNSFVIKGNSGAAGEKTGTLEFLSPSRQDVFFTLTFRGLGIVKVAPLKFESGSEAIRSVRAEMYCEQISLSFGAAAVSEETSSATAKTSVAEREGATPVRGSAVEDKLAAAPTESVDNLVESRRGVGLKFRS